MVLQREKPVPVWGWAKAGTQVEVSFGGQKKQATADEHGYWKAMLDPLTANRAGQVLQVQIGGTVISHTNVLVGEVWITTGQSNMLASGPDRDTGVYPYHVSSGTKGGKPEIRICNFGGAYGGASLEPLDDSDAAQGLGPWSVLREFPPLAEMGPENYFARVIRDTLDIPVGIIQMAACGVGQQTWMARATLEGFPALNGKGNYYQELLAGAEANLARTPLKSWAGFKQAEDDWRVAKKGQWPGCANFMSLWSFPGVSYNTKIHPLAPFAVRGALWHQGEAGPGGPYGERLVAMVKQWRALFGQDFCFVWGTLARMTTLDPPPLTPLCTGFYRTWNNPAIRQALTFFGEDQQVALVELYDLGDDSTHFGQKNEMGRRYGLAALTVAYGQNSVYTGPRMAETKIEGNKAIVRFEQVGDGLRYQPSIDGISGVYLHGKNGPSRWGTVKILSKDTVEISHSEITNLVMVSYAENSNPHETLFNSAGLPASPFTVNRVNGNDPPAPYQLIRIQGKSTLQLSLCHVRRSGYVFQVVGQEKADPGLQVKPGEAAAQVRKNTDSVTVQAYIPAEWKGFEIEAGSQKIESTETSTNNARFATFQAPLGMKWIIVAEDGKATEFRKVNRF